MRKFLWRLHSVLGLTCGLALLVIGVTGAALVFHEELDGWFYPEQTRVTPTAEGRLPYNTLLGVVEQALPGYAITGWHPREVGSRYADGVFVIPYGGSTWHYLTVDPYRGAVLSDPRDYDSTLKGWLLQLHYTFFLDDVGQLVCGLLGAALCLLGVSGLWIYRRFWRNVLTLRWQASARMVWGNAHRLMGVCSVAFNLVLGFTGAYLALPHAVEELLHLHDHAEEEPVLIPGKLYPEAFDLDRLIAAAPRHLPGFKTNYISLPWVPEGPVTLWGTPSDAEWYRSKYGSQVAFASADGQFTSAHDVRTKSLWQQVVDAFEPLHFGDFGGWPVQVLWALAGLAPGALALTGMVVWWHRRPNRASLRARRSPGCMKAPDREAPVSGRR